MHEHPNLVKEITDKLAKQEALGGIHVDKLSPGTRLEVRTRNTLYEIEVIENREIWVTGGKYFPTRTRAFLQGSTWGGSMIKIGWIGYEMSMEILHPSRTSYKTSFVRQAKIIAPDGSWEYEMEWSSNSASCNACAIT